MAAPPPRRQQAIFIFLCRYYRRHCPLGPNWSSWLPASSYLAQQLHTEALTLPCKGQGRGTPGPTQCRGAVFDRVATQRKAFTMQLFFQNLSGRHTALEVSYNPTDATLAVARGRTSITPQSNTQLSDCRHQRRMRCLSSSKKWRIARGSRQPSSACCGKEGSW